MAVRLREQKVIDDFHDPLNDAAFILRLKELLISCEKSASENFLYFMFWDKLIELVSNFLFLSPDIKNIQVTKENDTWLIKWIKTGEYICFREATDTEHSYIPRGLLIDLGYYDYPSDGKVINSFHLTDPKTNKVYNYNFLGDVTTFICFT